MYSGEFTEKRRKFLIKKRLKINKYNIKNHEALSFSFSVSKYTMIAVDNRKLARLLREIGVNRNSGIYYLYSI